MTLWIKLKWWLINLLLTNEEKLIMRDALDEKSNRSAGNIGETVLEDGYKAWWMRCKLQAKEDK